MKQVSVLIDNQGPGLETQAKFLKGGTVECAYFLRITIGVQF